MKMKRRTQAEDDYYPSTMSNPSNNNNEQRKAYLIEAITVIQKCQASCQKDGKFDEELFFRLKAKQDALFAELACLDNPELKGRTCPLCHQKFDGYGNNPAPLRVEGQVCDACNANRVIPARFRKMRK